MLLSLLEIYCDRVNNQKICFKMYSEAVKLIHGPRLEKGVQERLPACVTSVIKSLPPDDKYTGFVEATRWRIRKQK